MVWVQVMGELQHSELLRWNSPFFLSMGYEILGDFEESAQEQTAF
jgi:hypothetical protein